MHDLLESYVDGQLRSLDGARRPGGEPLRQLIDSPIEIFRWHGAVDEPDPGRFFASQCITGEQELLGPRITDELWPDGRPAVSRDVPDLDVRIGNLCMVCGDDEVAEQRDRGAQADGRTIYLGENGRGTVENGIDQVFGRGHSLHEQVG